MQSSQEKVETFGSRPWPMPATASGLPQAHRPRGRVCVGCVGNSCSCPRAHLLGGMGDADIGMAGISGGTDERSPADGSASQHTGISQLYLAASPPLPPMLGPPVGLSNLGNTCYLNAATQLLLACAPLIAELRALQSGRSSTKNGGRDAAGDAPMAGDGTGTGGLGDGGGGSGGDGGAAREPPMFGRGPLGFALLQAVLHASGG
eukprot:363227-Chlamydomonas_euryale.AAC.5